MASTGIYIWKKNSHENQKKHLQHAHSYRNSAGESNIAQPTREEVYFLPSPITSDVRVGLNITPTDDNGLFIGESSGWFNPGGLIYKKSFVSKTGEHLKPGFRYPTI